jgi:hypothetical protein
MFSIKWLAKAASAGMMCYGDLARELIRIGYQGDGTPKSAIIVGVSYVLQKQGIHVMDGLATLVMLATIDGCDVLLSHSNAECHSGRLETDREGLNWTGIFLLRWPPPFIHERRPPFLRGY